MSIGVTFETGPVQRTKDRPILFSGSMVRAILEGAKTQTRRVVKPQPELIENSGRWVWPIPKSKVNKGCCESVCTASREWWEYLTPNQLPYTVGGRLWVRESFQALFADGVEDHYGADYKTGKGYQISYMATDPREEFMDADDNLKDTITPSIFMPRWASRITLEITHVCAEPLQEISAEDAWAEGVPYSPDVNPVHEYQEIWERINGAASWAADPWVWVIHFKRVPQCNGPS